MADGTITPETEGTTTQTTSMESSGGGSEPRTFTQEDVDRIVKERLSRAKATPPADYEDLKAKAAKYDELEAANKSDIERANDAAARAKTEAADWKAKYEAMEAEREHERVVRETAKTYGVEAEMLARMSGDVEENAKYLREREDARPKFGSQSDGGQQRNAGSLEERLKSARNESEAIDIRAQWIAEHRKH